MSRLIVGLLFSQVAKPVINPVSGDLATTANFALVVSGVPTNGENL